MSVVVWFGLVWSGSARCIQNYLWVKVAEDFANFEKSRAG